MNERGLLEVTQVDLQASILVTETSTSMLKPRVPGRAYAKWSIAVGIYRCREPLGRKGGSDGMIGYHFSQISLATRPFSPKREHTRRGFNQVCIAQSKKCPERIRGLGSSTQVFGPLSGFLLLELSLFRARSASRSCFAFRFFSFSLCFTDPYFRR